jgi:hypothetical protein
MAAAIAPVVSYQASSPHWTQCRHSSMRVSIAWCRLVWSSPPPSLMKLAAYEEAHRLPYWTAPHPCPESCCLPSGCCPNLPFPRSETGDEAEVPFGILTYRCIYRRSWPRPKFVEPGCAGCRYELCACVETAAGAGVAARYGGPEKHYRVMCSGVVAAHASSMFHRWRSLPNCRGVHGDVQDTHEQAKTCFCLARLISTVLSEMYFDKPPISDNLNPKIVRSTYNCGLF